MSKKKVIYSFENISVYESDVDRLKSCEWINDTLLYLAGRKIEIKYQKEIEENHKNFMFYPPNTLELVRFIDKSMVLDIIKYWNVFNSKYVFLPLNDGGFGNDQGSHWSLVIWDTQFSPNEINFFYNFDSIGGTATRMAKSVCKQLCNYYGVSSFKFFAPRSPQQDNSYDCGLFVVAIIEYVAKNMDLENIKQNISQKLVSQLREDFTSKYMT